MGKGQEIGEGLQQAIRAGRVEPLSPHSLANRMLDALGDGSGLRGPLRDLGTRPLFLQILRETKPSLRLTGAVSLSQELAETYAPAVLNELLDLVEAAAEVKLPGRAGGSGEGRSRSEAPAPTGPRGLLKAWKALGPGLALAASMALVLQWLGGELERVWPQGWSAGVALALGLVLVQALALGPLKRLRRRGPLRLEAATDPHRAWCWLSAPWVHHRTSEAAVNVVLVLLLLGPSPLPLGSLLLRYSLTSLATMALGVGWALGRLRQGIWDGASGAIAALIALAAMLSLLHWRAMGFTVGPLLVPAWVLLLINGALQLRWVLPRQGAEDGSLPAQRLLGSSWWWGTVLGALWAVITRVGELVAPLLEQRAG